MLQSSHTKDKVSEKVRRDASPGRQTTMKFNVATSDLHGQTGSVKLESKKTAGPISDKTMTRTSMPISSANGVRDSN